MTKQEQTPSEYRCPGERPPISRAVHLGRLARFYPPCRNCAHRDDTATLSARQVKRLVETRRRGRPRPLFDDEGAVGVYANELKPVTARKMAAALGVYLQRQRSGPSERPVVVIASDDRALTPEILAGVGEGLRWAGCHVVDVGPATAACLAFAIDHFKAAGGILVGNPTSQVQTVGLKFWAQGARPISAGGPLETVRRIFDSGADRPTRKYGTLRRFQAEVPYLATLAEYYHALRPLRFVLDTNCPPLVNYLGKLTQPVACEVIPCRTLPDKLSDEVRNGRAQFAVRIDDDGERCRLLDEHGRQVASERFFLLLAQHLLTEQPNQPIVLEDETPTEITREICRHGGRVISRDPRRATMHQAMRENRAIFGGGPSGRFWYRSAHGHCSADALITLTLLLRLLSQSDRRLSEVLDAGQPLR